MIREPCVDVRLLLLAVGLAVVTLGLQYVVRPEIGLDGWAAWTAWAPSLSFSSGCVITALAFRSGQARLLLASSIVFVLAFELIQRWHPGLTFTGQDVAATLAGICAALLVGRVLIGGLKEVGI